MATQQLKFITNKVYYYRIIIFWGKKLIPIIMINTIANTATEIGFAKLTVHPAQAIL
jgi:hypothetical protein